MKKGLIAFILSFSVLTCVNSQFKYLTTQGYAHFFSTAPLENIEAFTNEVNAVIDFSTGQLLLIVPVKSFVFEKDLMRRHFNEQYMETHKYPEARFSGKIIDFNPIIQYYERPREVKVSGTLSIHGVSRNITETATLFYSGGQFEGETFFKVRIKEYNIKVPRILVRNIAETIDVSIKVVLEKEAL